jgi:3-oxoacyl-[acyl-carrier protein] reductase
MKFALVTGACINTGVAIVEKFLSEGVGVVFTGRNAERVAAAKEKYLEKFPEATVLGYALDSLLDERTVDEGAIDALFADLDERGIFVEHLVLNAADQGLSMKVFENPLTDFMRVLNTNVTWNYALCERAAARMKENGGGSIVIIGSAAIVAGGGGRADYAASKSGLEGLNRAVTKYFAKENIRCNIVHPSLIETDLLCQRHPDPAKRAELGAKEVPLGRLGKVEDIANTAIFLLSEQSSYITAQSILVDGGRSYCK